MEWMSPLVNWPSCREPQAAETTPKTETDAQPGIRKACQEFEAFFTASLFSEMTKSLEIGQKQGFSSKEEAWMWKLVGQTVAEEISKSQSLGLSQEIEEAMPPLGLTPEGLR